ncbi:MAG TPA: DUF4442 domain-containing protein [Gammaproteobacteria bacterium]|nr:DUF4442 domain-containing protein [Gammaproteobacteria bacterium]
MLSEKQIKFQSDFLSPLKQKLFYLKDLPMGLIAGIRLIQLDESVCVTEVPFRWRNKNPFRSIYFAVQSMAAELSTAAPVLLVLKGLEANIAYIIVDLKVTFVKKAQSKITFTCTDYGNILDALSSLRHPDDNAEVTLKTVGRDAQGEEVAVFHFTWSFKVRSC